MKNNLQFLKTIPDHGVFSISNIFLEEIYRGKRIKHITYINIC
ncbi:hypothetical protein SAMN04515674_11777 [Pseudarcicella hirudinis]|uniref:Uncharacterized protein n=1 Tax=Pseudarcicella hirudinis TaxID=1079859 RepID=A0A1I5Y7Q2_9BACT|nr:hypothetical protein SAMN04515674_11777 [Pseudarcicella hirudinis]